MSDELQKIDTPDGKFLYFLFNPATTSPGKKLAILAHGLTGRPREFINVMAMRILTDAGYDVARIFFYCGEDNARRLKDCTAAIHAQDLNTLTNHFRGQYPYIAMAGHSYGGLSMLLAKPDIDAAAFWDSAYKPGWYEQARPLPGTDLYTLDWGQNHLVTKVMYDEAAGFASNPPETAAKAFKPPALCVFANPNDKPGRNRVALFEALVGTKERIDIPEANHEFTIGDTVEQLLAHTTRWFDKYAPK